MLVRSRYDFRTILYILKRSILFLDSFWVLFVGLLWTSRATRWFWVECDYLPIYALFWSFLLLSFFFPLYVAHVHGEKFNLSKQRLHVLMMNNTVTTCLRLLHCSRQPYPFPHSSLQESSILHHTHFPLIHSPSHSLTYMESHGCMLSFTPSHTH